VGTLFPPPNFRPAGERLEPVTGLESGKRLRFFAELLGESLFRFPGASCAQSGVNFVGQVVISSPHPSRPVQKTHPPQQPTQKNKHNPPQPQLDRRLSSQIVLPPSFLKPTPRRTPHPPPPPNFPLPPHHLSPLESGAYGSPIRPRLSHPLKSSSPSPLLWRRQIFAHLAAATLLWSFIRFFSLKLRGPESRTFFFCTLRSCNTRFFRGFFLIIFKEPTFFFRPPLSCTRLFIIPLESTLTFFVNQV